METLVSPEQHWIVWALLLGAAAFGLRAERTRWGARVSGAVLTIGATFVLSNLRILPAAAPAYDLVWSYFVPLAIPILLFHADLRRILREAGPMLGAFAAGAAGTVIGTVVAFWLVPLGEEGPKLAGIFCATYIGGSLNYAGAAEALGLRSGDLLAAGVAADNVAMTLYFLVLFALPSIPAVRRWLPLRRGHGDAGAADAGGPLDDAVPVRLRDVAAGLALSAALCAAGYAVAAALGQESLAILFITALAVALATLLPGPVGGLTGAREMGTILMQIFFAVIGASANLGVVLRAGPILLVFAALILTVHLAAILVAGKLFRIDLAEVVVASNANMGGPTTAAAMAAARRWDDLVTPAILCGTLGYATATFLGVAVGNALR